MRIITLIAAVLLTATVAWAQSPQRMSYQAVIRNSSNALVANIQIGMQISILKGSISGTVVYTETQTPTTNANGLVSIAIGDGAGFSTINWANDIYFIKTETDPTGGTNYTITGISQLLSVPYAFHATTSESLTIPITESDPLFNSWNKSSGITITERQVSDLKHFTTSDETDPKFNASVAKNITATDTAKWNNKSDFDGSFNSLSIKPSIPSKTSELVNDAGFIINPNDADSDPTNELQLLRISEDTIYLNKGGFVKIPAGFSGNYYDLKGRPMNVSSFTNDAGYQLATDDRDIDPENEMQWIFRSTNDHKIGITNGGWVNITEVEGDPLFMSSPAKNIINSGSGAVISNAERTKLNSIEAGGEVNVQADWHQTDITADDYIKNKLDTLSISNRISRNAQAIIDSTASVRVALAGSISGVRKALVDSSQNLRSYTLGHIISDEDIDAANELNTTFEVSGTNLQLTDAGGTLSVPITNIIDTTSISNRINRNAKGIIDSTVSVRVALASSISDVHEALVDSSQNLRNYTLGHIISDEDVDAANELNTTFEVSGTNLQLTDAGGTLSVPITNIIDTTSISNRINRNAKGIIDSTASVRVALADSISDVHEALIDSSQNLRSYTLGHIISDEDVDAANELNTTFEVSGSNLLLTDAGGTLSVPVSDIIDTTSISNRIDRVNNIHDLDGDTKINTEENPDEDIIRFHLEGTEKWTMSGSRFEPINTGKSVFIGEGAGISDDLSDNCNTFIGFQSGFSNTTGYHNTALGFNTLYSLTQGHYNTAIGFYSIRSNTVGFWNTAIGYGALSMNENGSMNTAIGSNALPYNKSGSNNLACGFESGLLNVTGSGNIFLGYHAGFSETGNNKLYIENSNSATPLIYGEFDTDKVQINGALTVKGNCQIDGNHTINGISQINGNLTLKGIGQTDGEFVSLFENTAAGNCDGIKIKLGKASANNGLPDLIGIIDSAQVQAIKNLLNCHITAEGKALILGEIIAEGSLEDLKTIGGLAVGVGNLVVGFINDQLHLPYDFPQTNIVPQITTFPGYTLHMPTIAGVGIPSVNISSHSIGPYNLPSFPLLPKIPNIDLSTFHVDEIELDSLSFWGIPDICFDEVVTNPLNIENEFIQFADVNNVRMGSIRAQSVENWVVNHLNPLFLISLRGALTSTLDKKHAQYHFKDKIMEALKSYYNIGVEYTSQNGDYAEWLEREKPEEAISAGDIVAVKAGKITKNLIGAEQVMAVSYKPIVLGNVPPEGKNHLGNNIAFMGQIPVKIMGSVKSGDYIVGNNEIPGFGIAVNPEDMTIENFKFAVGRAWDSNPETGPKLINCVVGVHNGDFINILKRYEQKINETEVRLETVESKIDRIEGLLNGEKSQANQIIN